MKFPIGWIVAFLIVLLCTIGNAQQIDIIKGFASVDWPDNQDLTSTKAIAYNKAILDGIEKQYGQVITQGNATYIKNLNNGAQVESKAVFLSVSGRYVKGEHLRTLSENYKEEEKTAKVEGRKIKLRRVLCTVEFEAREIKEAPVTFKAFTSRCDNRPGDCKSSTFVDNDNVYLYFKSPESGFINVYADQEIEGRHITSRFLPGDQTKETELENGIPVTSDQEYIFFSTGYSADIKGYRPTPFKVKVDGNEKELLKLFIIFSKSTLSKPMLSEIQTSLEFKEKFKGFTLPKGINTEEFIDWLNKTRVHHSDVSYDNIVLSFQKFGD